ncbi:MAG: hypothetical protein ACRD3V_24905, partial [Vicinamibacteria bacterium]
MIQTDDLFLGAYLLIRGGELRSVEVRGTNGRRTAVFRIEGAAGAEAEYYGGKTVVNLQLLKLELKRLKDRAFEAIREEERYARHERRDRADQIGQRSREGRGRAGVRTLAERDIARRLLS